MSPSAERTSGRLRALTMTALFAAILAVICPISIPIGAIPITFSLLVVYLAGGLLGPGLGTLAVLVYLALGAGRDFAVPCEISEDAAAEYAAELAAQIDCEVQEPSIEVNPENDCAWIQIYKRLEQLGQLDKLTMTRPDKGYEKVAYPRTINQRGKKA